MVRVLVVEDEANIREMIALNLRLAGMEAVEAESAEAALPLLEKKPGCDAAILDVMLPGEDGFSILKKLRNTPALRRLPISRTDQKIGIIILSAKGQEQDKIRGLSIGADDYIAKPFQSMELVARVRSHLRRYEQILNLKNETKNEDEYMIGDLVLNNTTKRVTLNSRDIKLTPKEFDILKLLISHPGQVFSSQQIYELVWKEEAINTETIMVHIRKLREKIEANPKKPIYIKVVWGQGYKMENIQ